MHDEWALDHEQSLPRLLGTDHQSVSNQVVHFKLMLLASRPLAESRRRSGEVMKLQQKPTGKCLKPL